MPKREPKIDAYIAKAAPFARPILEHLRAVVHDACPEAVESIKWGMPFFDYHGPLCALAAFKAHCAFRLWKGDVLQSDPVRGAAMGAFGHLTRVEDLPPTRALKGLLEAAMQLNEGGVKAHWQERRQAKRGTTPTAKAPADLIAALKKSAKARSTWEGFPPSHRREYSEWIDEAKREETRAKRVAQTLEWLVQGKSRNWKYAARPTK